MSQETAARPARKEAMKPAARVLAGIVNSVRSRAVRRPAPAIAMEPSMNEKRAASSRFKPRSVPVRIVEPERETPGMRAMDWAIPISRVFFQVSFLFLLFGSGIWKSAPTIIITIPTERALRKIASIWSSSVKPMITAGIVAKMR